MKQHLCALLCLMVFLILAAASAGALITLPSDLTVIGQSAFSGIGESIALVIPDGVTEIPAGAFSGTKIHSVVFPAKMLPAGAVGENAFDWDALQFVTAYKGSEEEREAFGETVYDFFLKKKEKDCPDLVLFRSDPYIRSVALPETAHPGNRVVLFPESKITLGVEAPNLFVLEPKWQWQQSADGENWTNCVLNKEEPNFYEGTVTAEPGMPRFYRATAVTEDGQKFVSENVLEIAYVSEPVLTFKKTGQEGTSAFFSWSCSWETGGTETAENESGLVFSLCRATEKNAAGDYVPGENDEIIETPLSGHECRVDLLRPEEEYAFYLKAKSGGVQQDGDALSGTETGSVSCVSAPAVVKVTDGPPEGPVFRALLIGEVDFGDDYCSRNYGDVQLMRDMLRKVKGVTETDGGAAYGDFGIAVRRDLTGAQILKAVRDAFKGADSDDVSLFFIATHGDVDHEGDEAGYLFTTEPRGEDGKGDTLPLQKLAKALAEVPGRVIFVLQSCGSGAAVCSEEEAAAVAASLNAAAVRAFAEAEEEDGLSARTGEFRIADKFYVLTASRYREVSWGVEGPDPHNYFTKDLVNGVLGTEKDRAGADGNDDGVITLQELHRYIQSVGDGRVQDEYLHFETHELIREYQKTQVYPEDGDIPLFRRE